MYKTSLWKVFRIVLVSTLSWGGVQEGARWKKYITVYIIDASMIHWGGVIVTQPEEVFLDVRCIPIACSLFTSFIDRGAWPHWPRCIYRQLSAPNEHCLWNFFDQAFNKGLEPTSNKVFETSAPPLLKLEWGGHKAFIVLIAWNTEYAKPKRECGLWIIYGFVF